MNYLLDTPVFIWWLNNSPDLSPTARKIITNPNHNIFVSHVSYWEIATKISIDRLVFPLASIDSELAKNNFDLLTLKTTHIIHVASLPKLHQDIFDRMLIAQAQIENLTLLTANQHIQRYEVALIW